MRCITQEDVSVGVNWPLSQCDVYSAVVKNKRHHSGGVHVRITSPVKRAVADDQIDNLASVLENHSLLFGKWCFPAAWQMVICDGLLLLLSLNVHQCTTGLFPLTVALQSQLLTTVQNNVPKMSNLNTNAPQ